MFLAEEVLLAVLAFEVEHVDGKSDIGEEWIVLDGALQAAVIVEEYMVGTIAVRIYPLDKLLRQSDQYKTQGERENRHVPQHQRLPPHHKRSLLR